MADFYDFLNTGVSKYFDTEAAKANAKSSVGVAKAQNGDYWNERELDQRTTPYTRAGQYAAQNPLVIGGIAVAALLGVVLVVKAL
jgi:hypothetical protein